MGRSCVNVVRERGWDFSDEIIIIIRRMGFLNVVESGVVVCAVGVVMVVRVPSTQKVLPRAYNARD